MSKVRTDSKAMIARRKKMPGKDVKQEGHGQMWSAERK